MINFSHPAFLGALLLLPLVWWILRKFPPQPKRQVFAPFLLLKGLKSDPKSKSKTPIPLLIFRLLLFSLLVFMLARPVYRSEDYDLSRITFGNFKKAILVVDDSFASAANWKFIKPALDETVTMARESGVELAIVKSCGVKKEQPILFKDPQEIANEINGLKLKACIPDRREIVKLMEADVAASDAKTIWFTDGIDYGYVPKLTVSHGVYVPAKESLPHAIVKVMASVESIIINVRRPSSEAAAEFIVNGFSTGGGILFSESGKFDSQSHEAVVEVKLPREVRAKLSKLELAGGNHGGGVWLFDSSIKQSALGIIEQENRQSQPLLDEGYYISSAAAPFADVEVGNAEGLMGKSMPLIVEGDSSRVTDADREKLLGWVRKGGIYLRFAGPRLEEQVSQSIKKSVPMNDPLLPVMLHGESRFGGLVNWQKEESLAEFAPKSPIGGVDVGKDKVSITRLLTFDPAENSAFEVWATASDGSPVIVAAREGEGHKVLVLTTATPSWSDFALSGAFVGMLEGLAKFGSGVMTAPSGTQELELAEVLDGYGRLSSAKGYGERPAKYEELLKPALEHFHAPGLYRSGGGMVAHNMGGYLDIYQILSVSMPKTYTSESMIFDFSKLLIPLLALFLAADMFVNFLSGVFGKLLSGKAAKPAAVIIALLFPFLADAASLPGLKTTLAYVVTGDSKTDYVSKKGLETLTRELETRTSTTLSPPVGIELKRDDLSTYQFLYFPLSGMEKMTVEEVLKLRQFMRLGGLMVIDSADGSDLSSSPYDNAAIATFLPLLALGQLYQMDNENTLSKSFYLLGSLTGKYGDAKPWVEKPDETVNDGASPVIIGSAGWAEAWARDENGNYLFPITNDSQRAREMAIRSGINMAVYALTGNYKSDQIHLEAITRRLK